MKNNLQKVLLSLDMLSKIKNAGISNPAAVRLLQLASMKRDPSQEYESLETAIAISQSFRSPFPIPDESVDGPIRFAFAENNQLIGMFPYDCHVLIAGQTGTGKSTLLKLIFSDAMMQGHKIWLFVKSNDMRSLISQNKNILDINFDDSIQFNPLNPCGIAIPDYCNFFADIICQANNVFDGSKNYILEHLNPLYNSYTQHRTYPSLRDFYTKILYLKHPPNSRTTHYRESVLNRLGGMLYGTLGNVFDCSIGHENALLENNCIFEIDNLTTEQQRFIVNLLLTKLFNHRKLNDNKKWMLVGIDDANLIFDASLETRFNADLPIIHHLLTTVRKSKINIFACTQTPHQVGASIHSNSFAKIMLPLSNGKDISCMQQSMGMKDPDQKAYCYKLKPREAIVKFSSRYQDPFLAKIPEVEL